MAAVAQAKFGSAVFFRQMVATSSAVSVAWMGGDVFSQVIVNKIDSFEQWDKARTARMGTTGFFVVGPIGFVWNQFIERAIPGRHLTAVFKKILCNALFAPLQISISFTTIALLSGRDLSHARNKIVHDLPLTFAVGSTYWPFIGFIQFRYVPLAYRPITGSLAGILYQTFFSGMANRAVPIPSPVPLASAL